jgi:hypothetical protein
MLVALENVTKSFGAVQALKEVSFGISFCQHRHDAAKPQRISNARSDPDYTFLEEATWQQQALPKSRAWTQDTTW